jgi:hypothetical protein
MVKEYPEGIIVNTVKKTYSKINTQRGKETDRVTKEKDKIR